MTIREATLGDIPHLINFQVNMALETENVTLDRDVLTAGINQLFKNPGLGKYYVAEHNTELVGCLMTTLEWSEWRNGTVLWIQSVYVSKGHRGAGVFPTMYRHIQQLVRNDGSLKGIRLYVDLHNQTAKEVYKKLGMNGDHYQVFEWMDK
jgi:ribosomal protein S18 acetylase RimI-like enzyme